MMLVPSTSNALVATTSRTKFQVFRRSLSSRKQEEATSTPPNSVHMYTQQKKPHVSVSTVCLFEPLPPRRAPPSKPWRFLSPTAASLPRFSLFGRSLHTQISQIPSGLPTVVQPNVPPRSTLRARLFPAPLMIRKDSGRLGSRSSYHTQQDEGRTRNDLITKCVYVPWFLHGDSAESHEWNAWLSNSIGHRYCRDLHF
ncbi:hypothetical protein BCR34DRAFT_73833 [Clohesyomyces aquaticus]|uniref:Uncharacterized protein n=1 Tax=Clohesyomyces aquaticus TaxID=1231657 RepID=A0A1Y2A362_9PLEO|nr:hypothetical protein BCR34DRAFT_73833 [Clohesyomyces aquaticus]